MRFRHYLFLLILNIVVLLIILGFQSIPGYMDAEYYYLGGIQLARGEGFTEPILWNYLDDPAGLPHPSHAYWMPLASLLASVGMKMTANFEFSSARYGFLIIAGFNPILTAALSHRLTKNNRWAFISGLLAIFSGFYLPFITTTDTFALSMFLGGTLFLFLSDDPPQSPIVWISTGIILGLLHFSRADGIIWLFAVLLITVYRKGQKISIKSILKNIFILLLGYSLIMAPWMYRNSQVFGTLLSPGGLRTLWLTNYNELFTFPADQLTFQNWWASGIIEIIKSRIWAAGINLQRSLAEQGLIYMTPLVILGLWRYRSDMRVQTGIAAWIFSFGLMTIVFPYAGARGGFFHSSAVLQPLFWAITPAGLASFTEWGERKRGWNQGQSFRVFSVAVVAFSVLLSAVIYQQVIGKKLTMNPWERAASHYRIIDVEIRKMSPSSDDIVMVKNPPGYYLISQRKAIVIPDGDVNTLLSVADRYGASYIVLEEAHPIGLDGLYQNPKSYQGLLTHVITLDKTHIFRVK